MTDQSAERKARVAAWFRQLRDDIVAEFERLEGDHGGNGPVGQFELRETRRGDGGTDEGGGLMSVMRGGRGCETVGVNISTVYGQLGERAVQAMAARPDLAGLKSDPSFWASGISLVAHMQTPRVPAVHMNTRMFWTKDHWWFGGGSDLNPALEFDEDTAHFHDVLRAHCDKHHAEYYARFKAWADEYFFVPHRGRARGVGGIFFDDLNTGDWEADFAFTQDVGRAFLPAYVTLVERRRHEPFDEADRAAQLEHRGLYAEYNLVYDRGTKFGLETGHDASAVLMSLPPIATWH